jgi:hypothetical protein
VGAAAPNDLRQLTVRIRGGFGTSVGLALSGFLFVEQAGSVANFHTIREEDRLHVR